MKRFFSALLVVGGFSAAVALGQATKPSQPAAKEPPPAERPVDKTTAKPVTEVAGQPGQEKPKPKVRKYNDPVPGSEDGKWTTYDAMHDFFVDRFVESEGFGIGRMMTTRDIARSNTLYVNGESYRIGAVRLVSLGEPDKDGKPGKAFAYEPGENFMFNDPRRNALKESEKKALGPFESEAMTKLRAGEQTVFGTEAGKPMLIGAIRAKTECIECHKVKEGTLLGAFRYPLIRTVLENGDKVVEP